MAKMKNILIQQDLDDTIVTLEKKPTGITDEDWKKMDKKVKSFIELHLADNVILRVGKDMNAKETWEKLEKLYKRTTLSRKNELYSLQMEEGGGSTGTSEKISELCCRFINDGCEV
ncbi:hypothetical protein ACLB2K_015546 [Fragaria x ananassa]